MPLTGRTGTDRAPKQPRARSAVGAGGGEVIFDRAELSDGPAGCPCVGLNAIAALSAVLSKLGATPVGAGKVAALAKDDTDPLDRFFN